MASIPVPTQINKFVSLEQDFGTTICPALWLKAAQLAEYVNASYPIGMVLFFEGDQDNLPAQPDPRFWQFLNGSTVSNANSPMNGTVLPDFRGKFFRHPATGQAFQSIAGADSIDLTHNHEGFTAPDNDNDSLLLDNGDSIRQAIGRHRHTMSNSTLGSVTTIPAHHELQCYVRIA